MIIPKNTYKYLSNLLIEEYSLLIEREKIIDKKSFEVVYWNNRNDLYLVPKKKDAQSDMNRYIKYLKNQDAKISKISNTEMEGVHLVINNLKNIIGKL